MFLVQIVIKPRSKGQDFKEVQDEYHKVVSEINKKHDKFGLRITFLIFPVSTNGGVVYCVVTDCYIVAALRVGIEVKPFKQLVFEKIMFVFDPSGDLNCPHDVLQNSLILEDKNVLRERLFRVRSVYHVLFPGAHFWLRDPVHASKEQLRQLNINHGQAEAMAGGLSYTQLAMNQDYYCSVHVLLFSKGITHWTL